MSANQTAGQRQQCPCIAAPLSLTWFLTAPRRSHRFELYRGYLAALLERDSEAGVVLADSQDLLVQSDPWQHPLVQRMLDEVSGWSAAG